MSGALEAADILRAIRREAVIIKETIEHPCKDGTTALAMRLDVAGYGDIGIWVPAASRKEKQGEPQ